MEKFARLSGVAYAALRKSHPIKLGQVHQLLAAGFGHASLASFRLGDLQRLNRGVEFVCFDDAAVLARARGFGFDVTDAQWRDVGFALRPSGVLGGTWLTDLDGMAAAARFAFEASGHPSIEAIYRQIGSPDGLTAWSSRPLSDVATPPEILEFEVLGAVKAFGEPVCLSVPVACQVAFERIGRRMYAKGELRSVERCGEPTEYEPEFEGEVYGMSED